METYILIHNIYVDNKMFVLNCMVGSTENKQISEEANTVRPLCDQVYNSIVIMNRWQ